MHLHRWQHRALMAVSGCKVYSRDVRVDAAIRSLPLSEIDKFARNPEYLRSLPADCQTYIKYLILDVENVENVENVFFLFI